MSRSTAGSVLVSIFVLAGVALAAANGITTTQTKTAAPVAVTHGATIAEGTSLAHARADHVHSTEGFDAAYVNATAPDSMAGKLTIDVGGSSFALKPASSDHVFMEWYARSSAPGTRSAYVGYASAGANDFRIQNSISGGGIDLATASNAGPVRANGSTIWTAGNDGAGSTLDADLLDGQSGAYYLDVNNATGVANRSTMAPYAYAQEFGVGTTPARIHIRTSIPFVSGQGMPILIFEGYAYGAAKHFFSALSFYPYDSPTDDPDTGVNFINTALTHFGQWRPGVQLANEGGKVSIMLTPAETTYYPRIVVRAICVGQQCTDANQKTWFRGWTFDETDFDATATDVTTPSDRTPTAANLKSLATGAVSAVNVQSAIEELEAEKLAKTGGTITGSLAYDIASAPSTFEIGNNAGTQSAAIDLHGATTYTDYAARLYRAAGDNGATQLTHRGTGQLQITTIDAAAISFATSNATRLSITADGHLVPSTSAVSNLGAAGNRWATGFILALTDSSVTRLGFGGSTNPNDYRGTVVDGATAIAHRIGNANALATAGAKIAAFYSDNLTTEKASIDKDGKGTFAGGAHLTGGTLTFPDGTTQSTAASSGITADLIQTVNHNVASLAAGTCSTEVLTITGANAVGACTVTYAANTIADAFRVKGCWYDAGLGTIAMRVCNDGGSAYDPPAADFIINHRIP